MIQKADVVIVGGGASGFFAAINIAEQNSNQKIIILEKSKEVLQKVKISGGGRCNVTHACFVPNVLAKFYPRGEKELRGPFNTFCSGDMVQWLEERGVELKIEDDGRMFPTSDNSQTIIDCFVELALEHNVEVITACNVVGIDKNENHWKIETSKGHFEASKLVIASGSNAKVWSMMEKIGHNIVSPVPSLFTFNCKDERIKDLMGVSVENVSLKVKDTKLNSLGDFLITHWGMSGPAVLKLSAWGARELAEKNYQFVLQINWTGEIVFDQMYIYLQNVKKLNAKKNMTKCPLNIPNRLWEKLVQASGVLPQTKWADINNKQISQLSQQLTQGEYHIQGKSTWKDEFVTAGGIDLKEIDFRTMESKIHKNLYFCGEVINIDAITGGFNFQNAWTTAYIVAKTITQEKSA